MSRIVYEGRTYESREGEKVLDALLRHGQSPPFSCRNGSCLVCLQRCVRGAPTEASQRALRPSLRKAGYFLPCRCVPSGDIEMAPPRSADLFSPAVVQDKRIVGDVCRLFVEPATSVYYHAGQFVNVRRPDGLTRSYSLASLPTEDSYLELHVKRLPGGAMSEWIFDQLRVGDEIDFHGPNGGCYYVPGSQDQNLLLVANGTGAAPLYGVLRDALHVGHQGRICFFHGSRTARGLYLHDELAAVARAHPSFSYVPCVSGDEVPPGYARGRADRLALERCRDLHGWRVFVAGLPQMVATVQREALRAGCAPSEIHADPYDTREAQAAEAETAEGSSGHSPPTDADPEMWEALGRGELLRAILWDFYTAVFDDALLAPYFRGVTKDRLVGQVYSFMRDVFTGQKSYFGMRPRTAHHWMVISDQIFDHREQMMEACLSRHGVPEHLVRRWRKIEEAYRRDIVKSTPWKLVLDGVEMPLDGFGEEQLSVGTICDGCQRPIEAGERATYHLRLGLTYCTECARAGVAQPSPSERPTQRPSRLEEQR
jgi:NAD(P)H-flavin reductase/ferredoxin/truncated hemoglobin YjbI